MITGWFLDLVCSLVQPIIDVLPTDHLSLPDPSGVGDWIASVDALVPVAGVLQLGLGMLAAVVLFFGLRVFFVLWHLVIP